MRIVVDTNVVASSIFFGGKPKEVIDLLVSGKLEAFTTKEIVEEYCATVEYLKNKYKGKRLTSPLSHIVSATKMIESSEKVKVCRDPDDDKFINCAIDSKSLYIVSGDKDLLVLDKYQDIEIITVSEFLNRYNKTK